MAEEKIILALIVLWGSQSSSKLSLMFIRKKSLDKHPSFQTSVSSSI